jgi:hypothetical protein
LVQPTARQMARKNTWELLPVGPLKSFL